MRQILFRGKQKDNGEWVYGFYYTEADTTFILLHRESQKTPSMSYGKQFICVDPETVGQYTGLTDKNGVKIFEGDIVKGYYFLKNEYYVGKVEYSEELSAYILTGHGCNYIVWLASFGKPDIEIIGNARDAPELLGRG
jgi:uncharacterized phage protein (TIGR01671 family)